MRTKIQFMLIENSVDFALIQMLNTHDHITTVNKTGKTKYAFSFALTDQNGKNSFESEVVSKLSSIDKGIAFMLKDRSKLIYTGNSCLDTGTGYTYCLFFEDL